MTIIPVDFAQITWLFTGAGLPHGAAVTLGVDVSTFAGSPTDAANDARDAFAGEVMTFLNSAAVLTETNVKFGPTATGPTGVSTGSTAGTGATAGMAPNSTFLVHKATLFGGRAGRGRMFLPGVAESSVDQAGAIDSGTVTALQGGIDQLIVELNAAGMIPVLLHGVGSPLTVPSTITTMTVDSTVATQRRRLRR